VLRKDANAARHLAQAEEAQQHAVLATDTDESSERPGRQHLDQTETDAEPAEGACEWYTLWVRRSPGPPSVAFLRGTQLGAL
jgi:hypothetical protein